MGSPLLGYIEPKDRTNEQNDAHLMSMALMPKFSIPNYITSGGLVKVILTDTWKAPKVVKDIGFEFNGFWQLTGSCVGASAGNASATLGFIQRLLKDTPTLAFVPFWPFAYGRTRANEGDRGQGEGAVDSVMASTLHREGVLGSTESGLPAFQHTSDGICLTKAIEMQWSDGNSSTVTKYQSIAVSHTIGTAAVLNSTEDIKSALINGYPVLDGCSKYVGHGSIKGEGKDAYVTGKYDNNGGHSTCFLGYWDHPNDGPLYLYSNQWPTQTYPIDPAGGGRCTVWLPESEVSKLFSHYGGGNGETVALSHLNWFPAQPDLPNVIPWMG